jgi:hypothetical protein
MNLCLVILLTIFFLSFNISTIKKVIKKHKVNFSPQINFIFDHTYLQSQNLSQPINFTLGNIFRNSKFEYSTFILSKIKNVYPTFFSAFFQFTKKVKMTIHLILISCIILIV